MNEGEKATDRGQQLTIRGNHRRIVSRTNVFTISKVDESRPISGYSAVVIAMAALHYVHHRYLYAETVEYVVEYY